MEKTKHQPVFASKDISKTFKISLLHYLKKEVGWRGVFIFYPFGLKRVSALDNYVRTLGLAFPDAGVVKFKNKKEREIYYFLTLRDIFSYRVYSLLDRIPKLPKLPKTYFNKPIGHDLDKNGLWIEFWETSILGIKIKKGKYFRELKPTNNPHLSHETYFKYSIR